MKIKNIECGFVDGRKDSDKLPGALASDQPFFFMDSYWSKDGPENVFNCKEVSCYVPNEIRGDRENEIFIGANGAVADAYDLTSLSIKEKEETVASILEEKKNLFPGYEFELVAGEFPISVGGGKYFESDSATVSVVREDHAIMSTHILYIKNYESILQKTKEKQQYKKV